MLRLCKKCLLIGFLIILLFSFNQKTIAYSETEWKYIQQNYTKLDLNQPNFESLADSIHTKKAFIASEIHGVQTNSELEYQLFTYLNQQAEVDFLLLEISFSSGYLLNEYVQSGNIELLDTVFSFYKGTAFWTQEEYQFFEKLYEYNQNVSKKITLIGIDIEHSLDSYNYLKNLNRLDQRLLQHLELNKEYHERLYNETEFDWQFRDNKMYQNFLYLNQIYHMESFFGQFGLMHCFKTQVDDFNAFAYLLNTDDASPVKEKVMVFMSLYQKSQYLTTFTSNQKVYYHEKQITNFVNEGFESLDGIGLVKLNQMNSPFNSKLVWFFEKYQIKDYNTVTTDYFDYLIFINRSQSSTPLTKINSFWEVLFNLLKSKLNL